jgi:hypothetical protein
VLNFGNQGGIDPERGFKIVQGPTGSFDMTFTVIESDMKKTASLMAKLAPAEGPNATHPAWDDHLQGGTAYGPEPLFSTTRGSC